MKKIVLVFMVLLCASPVFASFASDTSLITYIDCESRTIDLEGVNDYTTPGASYNTTNTIEGNSSCSFYPTDYLMDATSPSTPKTVNAWIYARGTGYFFHFGVSDQLYINADSEYLLQPGAEKYDDGENFSNNWTHLVWSLDGAGDVDFYVNGNLQNAVSGAWSGGNTFDMGSTVNYIGTYSPAIGNINGEMDQILYFDTSLSALNVSYLFNGGAARTYGEIYGLGAPITNYFTISVRDSLDNATLNNAQVATRITGSGDPYYYYNTTNGVIVTPILNNASDNYDLYTTSNESGYGLGYIGVVNNNYDVSTNLTVSLSRIKPKFSGVAVINGTNTSINAFTMQVATTNYSTTNGTVVTGWTFDSGLKNVTFYSTGYYNRTYANFNLSANITGVLFAVIIPEEPETPASSGGASDEMYLFMFLFIVLMICAIGSVLWNSLFLGGVSFLGFFILFLDVLTENHFTIFSEYTGLLIYLFPLFLILLVVIVWDRD